MTKQDLEVADFAWSPDGTEIAARVMSTPRLDDVYWNGRLVVKRDSGEIARTLSETAAGNLEWSPDGKTIYFHALTPQKIATLPALVSATGGTVHRMLDAYSGTLWAAKWLPDSKQLLGEVVEGTRQYVVRIDAASGAITRREQAWHDGAAFTVSRDGTTVAYLRETADNASEVGTLGFRGRFRKSTTA